MREEDAVKITATTTSKKVSCEFCETFMNIISIVHYQAMASIIEAYLEPSQTSTVELFCQNS